MKKKLNSILLIDDDDTTNFLHEHFVGAAQITEEVITKENGKDAIDYLTSTEKGKFPTPDLVFLDINMPVMDGWEFLKKYDELPTEAKAKIVLFMLTTSLNPEDKLRASKETNVNGFKSKPLDNKVLQDILNEYFPDYL